MRAAPHDKLLSDDEWAQIASDVMHRTGLSPYGQDDDAVRWVAIRHGDDHIHIVAMLARQDGRRPGVHNDRYRVREARLAAEQRYGLRLTAAGDRTAARQPARADGAWTRHQGSPCGVKSASRLRQPPTSRSSSPTSSQARVVTDGIVPTCIPADLAWLPVARLALPLCADRDDPRATRLAGCPREMPLRFGLARSG